MGGRSFLEYKVFCIDLLADYSGFRLWFGMLFAKYPRKGAKTPAFLRRAVVPPIFTMSACFQIYTWQKKDGSNHLSRPDSCKERLSA